MVKPSEWARVSTSWTLKRQSEGLAGDGVVEGISRSVASVLVNVLIQMLTAR